MVDGAQFHAGRQQAGLNLLRSLRAAVGEALAQGFQFGRTDEDGEMVGFGFHHLHGALNIHVQNHIEAFLTLHLDVFAGGAVELIEDLVPLQKAALLDPGREGGVVEKVIVAAVDFPGTRVAGGGGNGKDAVRASTQNCRQQRSFSDPGRSRDDHEQPAHAAPFLRRQGNPAPVA